MPDCETAAAGLRARTDLPPMAAAAVGLLLWHESWLRREDFRRACLITNPVGVHWAAVREFCDSSPPGASTSQLIVLEVALAIVEDQFKFRHLGHAHRRAVAEAFATALGQELTPAVPQHNHPEFIPADATCPVCAREASNREAAPSSRQLINEATTAERERIAAEIDPARLEALAAWFDTDDEFKVAMFPGTWAERGHEAQDDLRRWAKVLRGEETT